MDITPPQAPPAQVQSFHQEASEAFGRLVGLQAWLATEQAGMPDLPETARPDTLSPYLVAMDAYWNSPSMEGTNGNSRRAALAGRLAGAARDLAVLAHEDGRLDENAMALIRSVASAGGANPRPGATVRELMFGPTSYAGVLLIRDEGISERTLVFSHDRGWETFPRLRDAHAELERRARIALVHTSDLAGIARQHLAAVGPDTFVDSREIGGNPFGRLADRLIAVQRDKLRQAWFEYSLADETTSRAQDFIDTAFRALQLDRAFDVEAMLATRHAALVETFNTQRLAHVPAIVAAGWQDASVRYADTLGQVARREANAGLSLPMDLPAYASTVLGERLRALGVTHDPSDVHILIDRSADVAARLESLQALFEGPAPERIKLIDLAYQNMAPFDSVRLSAIASDGTVIAGLHDAAIRRLVRDLDLSTRFQAYMGSLFRSGSEASIRREGAAALQRAHMGFLAAEARLSYYMDDTPRSFVTDRGERGYRWVKAALDAPTAAGRTRVEGHEVVVRQITYLGTPLRDILAFGVRQPESVASIVLYTPDAPDGISFREFTDRAEAGRRFFYHPAFREYLLDRLPADYGRVLANGATRQFVGDNLANWVLGSSSAAAYTRTQAPFDEREVSGDFLEAAYEVDVQLGLRNAQTFTRSAEDAHWTWLVERLRTATTHRIVEDAIKGVVTAPARAAQAAWRVYDNVKAGDTAQAVVDFADFYNTSLSAALPVYALSSSSVAHAIAGARFRAAGRLVEARPAVQPVVVFEPRFVARNVRKTGQANAEGIFTIGGKTYIEHDGQLYRVIHDSDYASWRLTRPDAGAAFRGPAIQRTSTGTWGYRRVGLRGGSGRGQAGSPEPLPDLYDAYQAEIELAFPDPVERDLVANRMRIERAPEAGVPVPATMISEGQRARWQVAFNQARWRHLLLTSQPGTSAAAYPMDLTTRFSGLRHVPRAQAPADLWYYGKMPFKDSDLRRHRGNLGYGRESAELSVRSIYPSVHGVRLTTVPPTASIERIREAMGAPDLVRGTTFSVRVDPNSLYEPISNSWNRIFPYAGQQPLADLVAPNTGLENVFFARPSYGSTLKLGNGQFDVANTLPPPAGP